MTGLLFRRALILTSLLLIPARSPAQPSRLRLPRLLGDGAVIQREAPLVVWGWAAPRSPIVARWRGATAHATADSAGRWSLRFAATRAGGPYLLEVRAPDTTIVVHDVLVGDVWLAGGQSNMEFPLARASDGSAMVAAAHDSLLRQFKVPIASAYALAEDVPGGRWVPADPAHAGEFSAVGYFAARRIRETERVPVGIVSDNWGGSAIETWLSPASLGLDAAGVTALRAREIRRVDSLRADLSARLGPLPERDQGMRDGDAPWADPSLDDASWTTLAVPAYWEPQGFTGVDGVGWYRTRFTLSADDLRAGVALVFAAIDDDDVTWVNGVEVGRGTGYNVPRRYEVPASALRVGENVLAVRVADYGGGGGINGPVSLALLGGTRSLAGRWRFRLGQVTMGDDAQHTNKIPTVAWQAMIAPLRPFAIRGVLWYQGESNANGAAQAAAYRAQFTSLIESWRRELRGAARDFPFLWVQLPGYGARDSVPPVAGSAGWAVQREAMEAALALPATGRAVTIDNPEWAELHPRDKHTVGDRLGLVAEGVAYRRDVAWPSPSYGSHVVRNGRMLVRFQHAGGGLVSHAADSVTVGAFALAGADRRWVWASARVVGDHVEVWSDRVPAPVAVRYAWANAPPGPYLYSRTGLPAAPFRSDRW